MPAGNYHVRAVTTNAFGSFGSFGSFESFGVRSYDVALGVRHRPK
jgi:hypothetical protein